MQKKIKIIKTKLTILVKYLAAQRYGAIVANLNLNQRRNFKSHLIYDITLKFKTEIKYEINFYYYFYFAFHLLC